MTKQEHEKFKILEESESEKENIVFDQTKNRETDTQNTLAVLNDN